MKRMCVSRNAANAKRNVGSLPALLSLRCRREKKRGNAGRDPGRTYLVLRNGRCQKTDTMRRPGPKEWKGRG